MELGRTIESKNIRRIGAAIGIGTIMLIGAYAAQENANNSPGTEQTAGCALSSPENKELLTHTATATTYWIGETPSEDNGFISNVPSQWESNSVEIFGGIDDPAGRDFTPRHNSFYFALPAGEFTSQELVPGARERSPWADQTDEIADNESLFKGRWIEVCHDDKSIYAQWHDVGPFVNDDYDYVFGTAEPKNTAKQQAGLDLSPDATEALGTGGSAVVQWRFVEVDEVPPGPWHAYPPITNETDW